MKEQFLELIKTAEKICIPNFDADYRYELLKYEKFYSIHQHSKGSRLNISGNHYHYIHDLTGKFTGSVNGITGCGRPVKERLLKADILEFQKHRKVPKVE